MDLPSGGAPVTVSGALAGGEFRRFVVSVPVVLVTVPAVFDVIVTTIVQPPAATTLPDAMRDRCRRAHVTPGQVPVLPPVVVTPGRHRVGERCGQRERRPVALRQGKIVSVAVPPNGIVRARSSW